MNKDEKIVKLKLDIIFKRVFGNERNVEIIAAFISDMLDIPRNRITHVEIKNVELPPEEIERSLRTVLPKGKLRRVIRPQQGGDDLAALYIYAHAATQEQAQKRLMEMLREEDPSLVPVSVRLRVPYRSERDAIHLLHLVGNAYEPPLLFARKKLRREIVG